MQLKEIIKKRSRNNRGFTLIEVIAVLVIVAIVSAVVISRGMDTDAVKLQTEVDTLKGHLRYAQSLALNDISPVKWGIRVDGTTKSYTLIKDPLGTGIVGNFQSPFHLPSESSETHSFAPITATAVTILFDEWGSPGAANIDITIGEQTITGAIKAETGFIP